MVLPDNIRYHWYDWEKGYDNTCVGWHEHIVHTESEETQTDIVLWLYRNIGKPERHCRWVRFHTEFRVKFRHERDYLLFALSW
jgi:hypothetical protein